MCANAGMPAHHPGAGMRIELLSIPGCPAAEEIKTRVSRVADAFAPDISVQFTTIKSPEEARAHNFIGSPSLRVNGLDVEVARRADAPSFSCRLYEQNGNLAGTPPESLLAEALARRGRPRKRILFLCTGNSCRSQMAEGWARALLPDLTEPFSAGIEAHGLNPNAVSVMAESGIDISGQRSQLISEFLDTSLDLVVTVCGHADRHCPSFPGRTRVVHVEFDDPPKLATQAKTEEEALAHYRRVRDQIRDFVLQLAVDLAREPGR